METIAVTREGSEPNAMAGTKNGGATPKVDVVALAVADLTVSAKKKANRIHVSNTKKPLVFYLNLAKKYIKQYNDVELSALGMAIPTVVTISEILKSNGLAIEKKVLTSSVGLKEDEKGRRVQKAKIEIVLEKAEKVDQSTLVGTAQD